MLAGAGASAEVVAAAAVAVVAVGVLDVAVTAAVEGTVGVAAGVTVAGGGTGDEVDGPVLPAVADTVAPVGRACSDSHAVVKPMSTATAKPKSPSRVFIWNPSAAGVYIARRPLTFGRTTANNRRLASCGDLGHLYAEAR